MNIVLSRLNQLKFIRDESNFPTDSVFWSNDPRSTLQEEVDGPNGFAPKGTRIAIKGTPSLGRVNTIIVGVRNPAGVGGPVLDDVNVWINELRVSGYDEEKGTAALINADIQLADLARIKANFRMQTSGFGALSSTLGERDQINARDWAVNTQVNLNKFIPERFGWSIPLTVEAKSNTSTPRFDPNRGDVRVDALRQAIEADTTLSAEETQLRTDQITEQAQTHTSVRSLTGRIQKSNSRSGLLRYTIDGLSYSYSISESEGRTPNQTLRNSWRWTSALAYRLTVRQPATVRPFSFLDGVPVLKVLGGLRFNYLPTAINLSANANRNFSETKERPDPVRQGEALLPIDVEFPLRPQHTFTHSRQFSLQYNPFGFLNLSFDTNTDQSLNAIGVDTLFTLIRYETDDQGNLIETRSEPSTENLLKAGLLSGEIDSSAVGVSAFQVETLKVVPFKQAVNRAFGSDPGSQVRTERYESRFNATFRPKINKFKPLDWITMQDIGYGVTFSWRNGSAGNNTGATVGTAVTLRGGVTLRPQDLFQKVGLYRALQEQQTKADKEKQARRRQKDQERQAQREQKSIEKERKREEKAARKAAEKARKAAEKAAEEAGLPPPEPEEEQPQDELDEQDEPDEQEEPDAGVAPDSLAAEADTTGGGFRLPLPNPLTFLRQSFLAATGVRDLNITYTGSRRTDATNIGRIDENGDIVVHYSLLDALGGQGPSLRYRLGLDRA
ncbi:MAG: cell surface protein SprA, partial [Rhodothermales bacterium]